MAEPARTETLTGWAMAGCEPDDHRSPAELEGMDWIPAAVPGTVAGALSAAGVRVQGRNLDAGDWWFRTRFVAEPAQPGEQIVLALGGLATVTEVWFNGERVVESESMYAAHRVDVTRTLRRANELVIWCRALTPLLHLARRPRARWRTRLVSERNLRFYRTMLLGRAPGFAPGPAAVGPFKPVALQRRTGVVTDDVRVRARVRDGVPWLTACAAVRPLVAEPPIEGAVLRLTGPTGTHDCPLALDAVPQGVLATCDLPVPGAELWWPHTHGTPALYAATLVVARADGSEIDLRAGRVGFRSLQAPADLERDGIQLRVNGMPVFARGAVWTPLDLTCPATPAARAREVLAAMAAAGMNMVRVPGIGCYESDAFHDLCDELGLLLWQDFMFANLDYPDRDPAFMETVADEGRQLMAALGGRPSLAVLCGGSEVAQQAAMMGLDPRQTGGPLYEELLPGLIAEADVDAPYLPSTPWGGDLPFRPDRGVANYYGVGAYLRPLTDARLAEVRFAGECLAFANVPDEDALAALEAEGGAVVHHPRWKAGVPRDASAGWDFEDVRDHYLRLLYKTDPVSLRYADHPRYLELSRYVTGEVMAEVYGEWRRPASPCGGGLVLWLTDLVPGAGWGILDHRGRPKVACHYLRRAWAPIAVWSTDEGLRGLLVHLANDTASTVAATLRIVLYQDFLTPVEAIEHPVVLPPHGGLSANVEGLLGHFVDITWAYRFGPPAQDLVVLTLESAGGDVISQAFRFPAGPPTRQEPAAAIGLSASALMVDADRARLTVSTRALAYGVRVDVPGFAPADDAFSVEPGGRRVIELRRVGDGDAPPAGQVTALNMRGRVTIEVAEGPA